MPRTFPDADETETLVGPIAARRLRIEAHTVVRNRHHEHTFGMDKPHHTRGRRSMSHDVRQPLLDDAIDAGFDVGREPIVDALDLVLDGQTMTLAIAFDVPVESGGQSDVIE